MNTVSTHIEERHVVSRPTAQLYHSAAVAVAVVGRHCELVRYRLWRIYANYLGSFCSMFILDLYFVVACI